MIPGSVILNVIFKQAKDKDLTLIMNKGLEITNVNKSVETASVKVPLYTDKSPGFDSFILRVLKDVSKEAADTFTLIV